MRRVAMGICAVLYLAACWAPQFWTASADAQEKPTEPALLEEVRARRFVLVDTNGEEIGVLAATDSGPALSLRTELARDRSTLVLSSRGLVASQGHQREDETWRETKVLRVTSGEGRHDPGVTMLRLHDEIPGPLRTSIRAGAMTVSSGDQVTGVHEIILTSRAVTLLQQGRYRAVMRTRSTKGNGAQDETTTGGEFVAYEKDGNVLWMEPR